jgi:hypothetical protein
LYMAVPSSLVEHGIVDLDRKSEARAAAGREEE